MLRVIKKTLNVISPWHTTWEAAGVWWACFHTLHLSGDVPHGLNIILYSSLRLRLQVAGDSLTGMFLGCVTGILPTGPGGRSWITCHCQGNLLLFDTEAMVGVVGKKMCHLCINENWLNNILRHLSEGDGCGFLKARNLPWSIFKFDYCFAVCKWERIRFWSVCKILDFGYLMSKPWLCTAGCI